MFRFMFVILALALYGAYCLVSSLTGGGNQDKVAQQVVHQVAPQDASQDSSTSFMDGAKQLAVSAASKATGFGLESLPTEGCSPSMIPPTKVEALVTSLPEPQRSALATVLNASSSVWTAQIYKGEKGVGLCLPVHEKLVVLPSSMSAAVVQLGSAVGPMTNGLTSKNDE
jgi:hypothetical protein